MSPVASPTSRLPSAMTGTRSKQPDQVALEAMPAQLAEKVGSLDSLQARGSRLRSPRAERVGLGTWMGAK